MRSRWSMALLFYALFIWSPSGSEAAVSVLGFELGKTKLGEIVVQLVANSPLKSRDASTSETSVCYKNKAGEFIIFAST